jgi:hypothetical protein
MNYDALNTIENHLSRIEGFADAAVDRVEGDPVLQTLLGEIKDKAHAIDELIQREG